MVMPPPAGGPAPQPGTVKISPNLPTFDGSVDADDHMELFVSIADAEVWNDDQRKLHFYKTLQKTALIWYMQTATVIQVGDWNDKCTLFLDYFHSPMYVTDRQVKAMSHKQEETKTIRDYANEKIRLWKRVDPCRTELALVTHIKLGL